MQGHPKWTGHSEEFWQNMVHWRREWQCILIFLNSDHGIWCHHFMANRGRKSESSEGLYFLRLQNHNKLLLAKWCLCFAFFFFFMTKLDRRLKSRDISLPTKVHVVKAMVFPVVMYDCELWPVKKAEYRRIDTFKLWWRRRLLRVPWTARRSKQSILKEINPKYSLEGLMLKLQYFGHLLGGADSLEKTLMLEKIEGRRRGNRGWCDWMASPTQWTWVWANSRK